MVEERLSSGQSSIVAPLSDTRVNANLIRFFAVSKILECLQRSKISGATHSKALLQGK